MQSLARMIYTPAMPARGAGCRTSLLYVSIARRENIPRRAGAVSRLHAREERLGRRRMEESRSREGDLFFNLEEEQDDGETFDSLRYSWIHLSCFICGRSTI